MIYFPNIGKYEAYLPKLVIKNTPRTQAALAEEKGHSYLVIKTLSLLTCDFLAPYSSSREDFIENNGQDGEAFGNLTQH